MKCEKCGGCLNPKTDVCISSASDESIHLFCKECIKKFGTCEMCQHMKPCGFFHDPDPMPQFIVVARTTQQGNATFVEQKQIPNPNRVKKFCIEGECKCFLNDLEHPICCRYSGCSTCTNYCEVEQFNFVQDFLVCAVDEN